ncbi:hypothetical protein DYB31_006694 [Aphanomyces astaci]|uniref:Spondin-like TSP1 domain-containing protein n=1 Tax=Aphanomyces astaci TaxID=112090 RepID=A0A397F921_APHAT|nr:hypothetical protein DYB31_006694 [Aphanomyces astaci]
MRVRWAVLVVSAVSGSQLDSFTFEHSDVFNTPEEFLTQVMTDRATILWPSNSTSPPYQCETTLLWDYNPPEGCMVCLEPPTPVGVCTPSGLQMAYREVIKVNTNKVPCTGDPARDTIPEIVPCKPIARPGCVWATYEITNWDQGALEPYGLVGATSTQVLEDNPTLPCTLEPTRNVIVERRVDCVFDVFSDWGPCNTQTNRQDRDIRIKKCPRGGGTACLHTRACTTPTNEACVVGPWGPWSSCSLGTETRTRSVMTPRKGTGKACPSNLVDSRSCDAKDCIVSAWSPFVCDPDTFIQTRTRTILVPSTLGGAACPPLVDTSFCLKEDCLMSAWACDPAIQTYNDSSAIPTDLTLRKRTVLRPALNGGAPCGPLVDDVPCNAVDCRLSDFGDWGTCDASTGLRTRRRYVLTQPSNGAKPCDNLTETKNCDPVPCTLTDWSAWGTCDVDRKVRTRTRHVIQPSLYGGDSCGSTVETTPCEPKNCVVTPWTEWSTCDLTYHLRTRTREITAQPQDDGEPCPDNLIETVACPPKDCVVSEWSEFGACDDSRGTRLRTRQIQSAEENGGAQCPELNETAACLPVDCTVTSFGEFSICMNGVRTRVREVTGQPRYNGKLCPDLTESVACAPQDCQVHHNSHLLFYSYI